MQSSPKRRGLSASASAEDLRKLSPESLLAAAKVSNWASQSRVVVDGWVIPQPPLEVYARGEQHEMPILVGSMADEGNELVPIESSLTSAALEARLQRVMGPAASKLLALYERERASSPGLAQREIFIDQFMAWSMRYWVERTSATGQPGYLYFFSHIPPAFQLYLPDSPELDLADGPRSGGAYHSGDLAYVFGTVDTVGTDWQERDRELSRQIVGYWTNFAKTGDPNGPGLPRWPAYDSESHSTMVFAETSASEAGVRQAKLDTFDEVLRWRSTNR